MDQAGEERVLARFAEAYAKLREEIAKVITGQEKVVEELVTALFAGGHCLLVGVPGLAKTLLVSTVSECLGLEFSRIQFTPDLMPSDIMGTEVLEEDKSSHSRVFRFIKGPVFSNIVLADEINRTPPKTQAALLQAMQEYKVTYGGETHELSLPFFVLATQNPIEQEGTYPLPEAQLDRFMFTIFIDYPSSKEEIEIVRTTTSAYEVSLKKVLEGRELLRFQKLIRKMPVADDIIEKVVRLVSLTRPNQADAPQNIRNYVSWGAGPRASQYLILGAKAVAALEGRFSPNLDDVKRIARPVLRHRIITNFAAEAEGVRSDNIIDELLSEFD